MKKHLKLYSLVTGAVLLTISFVMLCTCAYAWYNGIIYFGKTMSYTRTVYIGSNSSDVSNYYGTLQSNGEFNYTYIDPAVGFEAGNLAPGSYIYLRTDINNQSSTQSLNASIFLQNVTYSEPLNPYLYFGTFEPKSSKEIYKNQAKFDSLTRTYKIDSILLLENYEIKPNKTLSLYWYVNIDSDAGQEIAYSAINLGKVILSCA